MHRHFCAKAKRGEPLRVDRNRGDDSQVPRSSRRAHRRCMKNNRTQRSDNVPYEASPRMAFARTAWMCWVFAASYIARHFSSICCCHHAGLRLYSASRGPASARHSASSLLVFPLAAKKTSVEASSAGRSTESGERYSSVLRSKGTIASSNPMTEASETDSA